jgi:ethanolamine phosphate transferase 2 subunit G
MKTRELCILVIICSVFQLVGVAFFARGFFPYKTVLPGFATENGPADFQDLGLVDHLAPPEKLFDRMVFIVIDALRR